MLVIIMLYIYLVSFTIPRLIYQRGKNDNQEETVEKFFSSDLKEEKEEQLWRDCGSKFHSFGTMALKDLPPMMESLVRGTARRLLLEDLTK